MKYDGRELNQPIFEIKEILSKRQKEKKENDLQQIKAISFFVNQKDSIIFEEGAENKYAFHHRVSTDDQKESIVLAHQRKEIVLKNNKGILVDEYIEEGISASKKQVTKRPRMLDLITDFMQGKFKNIISYNQDRLFRNDKEAPIFIAWMLENGLNIYYTRGGVIKLVNKETLGKFGIMEIQWEAQRAHEESIVIGERVADNRDKRFKDGKVVQSFLPYGYKKNEQGKIEILTAEREMIEEVENLYLKGIGIGTICNWLNGKKTKKLGQRNALFPRRKIRKDDNDLWTKESVQGLLFNKFYHGIITNNYRGEKEQEEISKDHEPIRKEERYNEIVNFKNKKIENKLSPRHYETNFLLKGILYCSECGEHFHTHNTTKPNGKAYLYYLCSSKNRAEKSLECKNKNYNKELIEEFVLLKVKNELENLDFNSFSQSVLKKLDQVDQRINADISQLESQLKGVEKDLKGIKLEKRDYLIELDGDDLTKEEREQKQESVEELKKEEIEKRNEKKEIEYSISQLKNYIENESESSIDTDMVFLKMKQFVDEFEKIDDFQKKILLEEMINKIEINSEGFADIEYKIPLHELTNSVNEMAVSKEVMLLGGVGELTTSNSITDLHMEESFINNGFSKCAYQNFRFWCEEIYFKAKANFKDYLIGSTLNYQKDGKMTWWKLHKDTRISQYTAKAYMQNEHFPTQKMFNKVFNVYGKNADDFLDYIGINLIKEDLFFEIISCVQTWHNKEIGNNESLKEINKQKLEHYKLPNTLNRMHIYVKKDD